MILFSVFCNKTLKSPNVKNHCAPLPWGRLLFRLPLLLLFFSCQSPQLDTGEPVHLQDATGKPAYLMGRLPGERWVEHNPPKMNARQSFEGYDRYRPCILGLFSRVDSQSGEDFLTDLASKLSNAKAVRQPVLKTGEGDWANLTFETSGSFARIYALQKAGQIYWIQLTSRDPDVQALCLPDTVRYIKNLYFIYR